MLHDYADIRGRIPEPPKWWDENGVPRWCDFAPKWCADIYAEEAALAEVTCQGCGRLFLVAFSRDAFARHTKHKGRTLAADIRERRLHYGDPPNIGCCAAGPTMNSEPRRVVEYWHRHLTSRWQRDPALEVAIEPDWVRVRDSVRARDGAAITFAVRRGSIDAME